MAFVESYLRSVFDESKVDEPDEFVGDKTAARQYESIWSMPTAHRFRLYRQWVTKYERQKATSLSELHRMFNKQTSAMAELKMQVDRTILDKALIIAMTTTGSSRYSEVLKDIGPRIVIVEEAAEVFEAHIVSSLSKHCEHLILIGDHVQLKPRTNVYKLAVEYQLDVSLFERLVNNGLPSVMLNQQHRMRPEISAFAKLFYQEPIYDHKSVEAYPNVAGMRSNVQFVSHNQYESEITDLKSICNRFEANYLTKLCTYLIKQGYGPDKITVITMYLGQLIELRRELRKIGLAKVRVSTVDNFQGEENDIVLVSLVRSNQNNRIG